MSILATPLLCYLFRTNFVTKSCEIVRKSSRKHKIAQRIKEMAFKLYNPYIRIYKTEKLFVKARRELNACYKNYWRPLQPSQTVRDYHREYCLFKSFSHCKSSARFVHIRSSLCSKVIPFKLSDIGEGIVEVVIKEWLIKTGDKISQFDPICEVQSDKASVTISSRYDGIVKKLYYEVDDTAKVGAPLIDIEVQEGAENVENEQQATSDTSKAGQPEIAHKAESHPETDTVNEQAKILTTPAIRRIAKENNIDLTKIKGSGRSGRILKEDLLSYLENAGSGEQKTEAPIAPKPLTTIHEDVVQEITGIRKFMVKSMKAAWEIPHFSYCDEISATELINMKDDLKKLGQAEGVKITFMPFFIKAASLALSKYPVLNSAPDENCEKIVIKSSHNIGVAIDTPHGLVVPNIKNVQSLNIVEIAGELNRLQKIAAKGQLGLDDLNGGTFTLSNIGIIGGTYMKPILVTPQVIIGAIGKVRVLPRFDKNRNIVEAHVFNISWSADHRVLDGATVARFSNLWKLYVEYPQLLLNL